MSDFEDNELAETNGGALDIKIEEIVGEKKLKQDQKVVFYRIKRSFFYLDSLIVDDERLEQLETSGLQLFGSNNDEITFSDLLVALGIEFDLDGINQTILDQKNTLFGWIIVFEDKYSPDEENQYGSLDNIHTILSNIKFADNIDSAKQLHDIVCNIFSPYLEAEEYPADKFQRLFR